MMTRRMRKHIEIVRVCLSATLGAWLTGSAAYAATVTIAVTPNVVDAVDTVAQVFEGAHAGDRVRIVVTSGTELMSSFKSLPVQVLVSDDSSLIEWMEERKLATRPAARPAIVVPLAVVSASADASVIGTIGDLVNRMKQQGTVLAVPDPLKTECGRRAQALLKTVGVNVEPSERLVLTKHAAEVLSLVQKGNVHFGLVFAPDVTRANGLSIHTVSPSGEFSPEYTFTLKLGQEDHAGAQRFLAFLNTSQGQHALKARGYNLAQEQPPVQVSSRSISR